MSCKLTLGEEGVRWVRQQIGDYYAPKQRKKRRRPDTHGNDNLNKKLREPVVLVLNDWLGEARYFELPAGADFLAFSSLPAKPSKQRSTVVVIFDYFGEQSRQVAIRSDHSAAITKLVSSQGSALLGDSGSLKLD